MTAWSAILAVILAMAIAADAAAQPVAPDSQSVRSMLELARTQSRAGDAPAALANLRRALTLAPNAEEVLSAYARVSLAARAAIPAAATLRALTRMCPSVADYHYLLGVALMQAGDTLLGSESLRRAEQLAPVARLTALGLALNSRKEYPEARQALVRSLEIDPTASRRSRRWPRRTKA